MPTCTRKAQFVSLTNTGSFKDAYVFTPEEIAFSQGWPIIDVGTNGSYMELMNPAFSHLSRREALSAMGNGMHLITLMAWNLYVAARCIRREALEGLAPPLFLHEDDEHEHELYEHSQQQM